MFYFEGSHCAGCGVDFKENDDIVACPICGTPHHRTCYKENGGCSNEALHADGYSWSRSENDNGDNNNGAESSGKVFCGVCGAENSSGRLYCFNCGKPLFDDEAGTEAAGSRGYTDVIDGVALNDVSKFIGNSGQFYAPMFYQMHLQNKKVSFNFFALLFPTFWFLSRKMYFHGISIILYNLVTSLYTLLNYEVFEKIYSAASSFDSAALQRLMVEYPSAFTLTMVFGLFSYGIAIISALFGNKMYMEWCLNKVRRLRKKHSDDKVYNEALEKNGRSNFGIVVIIMLLYFIATMGMDQIVGYVQQFINYLSSVI